MAHWRITKALIPPGIALFIALVGWILTEKFNATQLEVTKQRNSAELEVARINAALRYIEFLRSAPEARSEPHKFGDYDCCTGFAPRSSLWFGRRPSTRRHGCVERLGCQVW